MNTRGSSGWLHAGGSDAQAVMAALIAMAESSGQQFAAVIISDDGANRTPWTTFTSGAYHGRC